MSSIIQPFKYESCKEASGMGDLEELKRMHLAGCPWDQYTTEYAARNGHLDCLQYAHSEGCEWKIMTSQCAAFYGHLTCLQYAIENGCQIEMEDLLIGYIPAFAAAGGHLDCLQYAHSKGIRWDKKTVEWAATGDHVECLRYAIENGCPWDDDSPKTAAKNGRFECFTYLFSQHPNPQEFWNIPFNLTKIIDRIDLDDPIWRRCFNIDLSVHHELQAKVNVKKREIAQIQQECLDILYTLDKVPKDVVIYCIFPFV